MGDLFYLDDHRKETVSAIEDAKDLSKAMAKYLQRADSTTGLLPSRDSEGNLIMIRTVRAVEWRGLVRKSSTIDPLRPDKQYVHHITNRGRRALKEYLMRHS